MPAHYDVLGANAVWRGGSADSVANAQFEKMKTLVGDWEYKGPDGDRMVDTFRIFGEGSAILHLEKTAGRQDVITIFYPVGAELRGDHYCFMKNQPRYVASPSSDPSVITFKFRDITNLSASSQEGQMHSTTWRFVDADHLMQEWHLWENGRSASLPAGVQAREVWPRSRHMRGSKSE
jgi:hypothetical protein